MNKTEAIEAIIRLIDHTTERWPHFESPRGNKDIADAVQALNVLAGLDGPALYARKALECRVAKVLIHQS